VRTYVDTFEHLTGVVPSFGRAGNDNIRIDNRAFVRRNENKTHVNETSNAKSFMFFQEVRK